MYKHIFGPVPSRRLGMSLGVDIVPHKVCTLNCVYCECGATTKLTTVRQEFAPFGEIISELDHFMDNNPSPDYITFSGSGEPSLYSRIGEIIDHIKKKYPDIPVAVLTNGTLFKYSEVRNELSGANLVLPSLDAVSDLSFRRINRPQSSLDSDSHIEGLIDFRREFDGKIWLEVFLLPEYNMDEEELSKLKSAIEKIRPDLIQLNTLDRPGAVEDLHPADYDEMKRIIGEWGFDNAVIIASPKKRSNMMAYRKDKANAIMETISRRPCTNQDLADILGLHLNDINKYLDSLEKEGKINGVQQQRGVFYQLNKNE